MFSSLFKYVTNDVISYGLISIMAPTKDQCCEVVKLNYESIVDHLKKVVKTMKKKHFDLGQLNTKQIQRIVKRFEESGSVENMFYIHYPSASMNLYIPVLLCD